MAVRISLDLYKILSESDFDIIVKKSKDSISEARKEIVQYLRFEQRDDLLVLVRSKTVLIRLEDLLTLHNVLPLEIIDPRKIIEEKLGYPAPSWLTNEIISSLGLLQSDLSNVRKEFLVNDVLIESGCNFFKARDFKDFISEIVSCSKKFKSSLAIAEVRKQLFDLLIIDFSLDQLVVSVFIETLINCSDIQEELERISIQQAIEFIKIKSSESGLSLAFPPIEIPSELTKLPLINFFSRTNEPLSKYIETYQALFSEGRNVENTDLLIDCTLYPWPELIETLDGILKGNPNLISRSLINKLMVFNTEKSLTLARKLEDSFKLSELKPLTDDENIGSVINWSSKYLKYIKQEFESEFTDYETSLSNSFSRWLLNQKSRIERSRFDWRHVSIKIEESLSENDITVVFMIDALSYIHMNELKESLSTFENLTLFEQPVFAPLPTLTKIGKKSVLTGLDPNKITKGDSETLKERYKEYVHDEGEFLFLQDWKRAKSNSLTSKTKLVVVYINEIDDRLHKTATFTKHSDDVKKVINEVRKTVSKWLKDSYSINKNLKIFITADHGLTSINSKVNNPYDCKSGERFIELPFAIGEHCSEDFFFLPDYSANGFLVPKNRAGIEKRLFLAHGGLTPEEVLIPLVSLSQENTDEITNHFNIEVEKSAFPIESDRKWLIKLSLTAFEDIQSIYFKCKKPFSGDYQVDSVGSSQSQQISLHASSSHPQHGRTEIVLIVRYFHRSKPYEREVPLIIDIPKPLLTETDSSKNFGAMFDL